MSPHPPRGLRWAASPVGKGLAFVLAMVSLLVSIYVGYRYTRLTDCLRDRDLADQRRTAAIAAATDAERAADLALIRGRPDSGEELRRAAVAAREHTDKVRALYPAPPVRPCR